jgi:DNA-directed RNA polymerase subunit M/transcription elongation factor TFIIS
MFQTQQIQNPDEFRNNIRSIFKKTLQDTSLTCEKIYVNMEIALFNYSIKKAKQQKGVVVKWQTPAFVQIYTDHLRSILYNLDNNAELKEKIIKGEIKPQEFVFMDQQLWCPTIWNHRIEDKKKKDDMKYNKTVQSSTDMFRCKKCGNNKCTYYEMQTRSADESATIFVNCLTCGKNWRE